MATRVVEGKKPYTGGKAISIDENKVISLNLRDENNLIIYDEGDDEIYVDLQLPDGIEPTDAFPVGVTTGRAVVADGWDKAGTIISAKTTSGDEIKILYADEGTLWIDNGTGTFKQIYFKADVDALLLALRNYIDGELAKKQNGVSSDTAPSNPSEGDLWYDTTNDELKVYDGSQWTGIGGGSNIEYKTQAEYNALLPGALTDNKHYFIYSTSGGGGWQPGVNTLFYFPFTTDQLDHVGSASIDTTGTQDTLGYNFTSSGEMKVVDAPSTTIFISAWVKYNSYENDVTQFGGTYVGFMIYNFRHSQNPSYDKVFQISTGESSYNASTAQNTTTGTRYHMAMGYDGTQAVAYINGQQVWSSTSGHYENGYVRFGYGIDMNVSEYIGESVCWTAQEVSDYYDLTKGNYGIS